MTQSERRLMSVGELTPDRLRELRRIAEAGPAGDWDMIELEHSTVLAMLDEIERLREMLFRLYQDTVSGAYCHRCSLSAGDHDETCAMAEVEALLGLEFERGVRDE